MRQMRDWLATEIDREVDYREGIFPADLNSVGAGMNAGAIEAFERALAFAKGNGEA